MEKIKMIKTRIDEVDAGSTGRIMKMQKIKHFKEEIFVEEEKFGRSSEICTEYDWIC